MVLRTEDESKRKNMATANHKSAKRALQQIPFFRNFYSRFARDATHCHKFTVRHDDVQAANFGPYFV